MFQKPFPVIMLLLAITSALVVLGRISLQSLQLFYLINHYHYQFLPFHFLLQLIIYQRAVPPYKALCI